LGAAAALLVKVVVVAAGDAAAAAVDCTSNIGELSAVFVVVAGTGAEGSTGAALDAGAGEPVCAWTVNKRPSNTAVAPLSFIVEVAIG